MTMQQRLEISRVPQTSIAVQALSVLGLRGGNLLARKNYAMTECVNVEIGMQTHSYCIKQWSQSSHLMKVTPVVILKAFILNDFNQQSPFFC